MSVLNGEQITPIPMGKLGIIAMPGTEELVKRIEEYITVCLKELDGNSDDDPFVRDSYTIDCEFTRFATGEGKVTINETVRGYDLFIVCDCFNYSVKYKMYDFKDENGNDILVPMSPDDHFADLKRVISACAHKARRITVLMPMLYEGRQHKRKNRESLDCAMMLQELENMGVANIITFDAHDPRVQNAIHIGFESVGTTYQMIKALARFTNNEIKLRPENVMMISPDGGGMERCVYYSGVLGIQLGMFYKRRDYSKVENGTNPIKEHSYLGDSCNGMDVIVVDDMISSGGSMLKVCQHVKELGAKNVYVFSTFGLFTSGLETFDKAYEDGIITQIFTTNLVYTPDALKKKPWYTSVDMSKFCAFIVITLNRDMSVSKFLNPKNKIDNYIKKYNLK